MKNKLTLEEDLSLGFQKWIFNLINAFTVKRFAYYHDSYKEKGVMVHIHKFKRRGVVSQRRLKELCKHLESHGIYGFKPTSLKTESHSGIALYHKVKIK